MRKEQAAETAAIAKAKGVTERQARTIKANGGTVETIQSLEEAKVYKMRLECQKLEHQVSLAQRKSIPMTEVKDLCVKIGSIISAEFASLSNDVPGLLEGLPAIQVRAKFKARGDLYLRTIKKAISELATVDSV
jgi:hypothetical protein